MPASSSSVSVVWYSMKWTHGVDKSSSLVGVLEESEPSSVSLGPCLLHADSDGRWGHVTVRAVRLGRGLADDELVERRSVGCDLEDGRVGEDGRLVEESGAVGILGGSLAAVDRQYQIGGDGVGTYL
jgi:hypothetical protein